MNCSPVVTKVGQLLACVDEFCERDGLNLVVVVYRLSSVVVGDVFSIVWSGVWVEQLHVVMVGDGAVHGQSVLHLHPFVCTK